MNNTYHYYFLHFIYLSLSVKIEKVIYIKILNFEIYFVFIKKSQTTCLYFLDIIFLHVKLMNALKYDKRYI